MISCLRGAGAEVIERHASVWERRRHNWSAGFGAAGRVGLAEARLLFGNRRERFDAVIVGYPGHFDLPAAKRIARGRPVLFNPLVSLGLVSELIASHHEERSGGQRSSELHVDEILR